MDESARKMTPIALPVYTPGPQMPGLKNRFHAMVKPVGSLCNLDCTYCYYLHKQELLGQPMAPRISDFILEQHIRQYIEAQSGDEVVFSWQGGEPTLLGIDFFRRVVELEEKYRKPNQRIENDLQTNGTLLDDDWATFLKEHNFLVGLSCDGPKFLHDKHRVTKGGNATHAKIVAAARLLKKYRIPFNALCVVNRDNVKYPLDVYRFLTRDLRAKRVQFIPVVEPREYESIAPQKWDSMSMPVVGTSRAKPGQADSVVTEWSVDPDDWGKFLCTVWDEWKRHDFGVVHVNLFETAVAQWMGMPAQLCTTGEFCGKAMAVEYNGDVYPCDHYVYPEYKVGNISEDHWGTMAYSEQQKKFGFAKCNTLPKQCNECEHLDLCWGECPRNRVVRTPDGEPGLNYLCSGLKRFFSHIDKDMPAIANSVNGGQARGAAL
jgi:uncharacterized protein